MTVPLTPRVGDRVLVSKGGHGLSGISRSATATVLAVAPTSHHADVKFDSGRFGCFPFDRLTVLDREPVEWPKGWSLSDRDLEICRVEDPMTGGAVHITFPLFRRIRSSEGDYVAEHWDELMGEA